MSDWRADSLVDELLPEELDWQYWVREYPVAALTLAAVGGFLLARKRGPEIVERVSNKAADTLSDNVQHLIESRT